MSEIKRYRLNFGMLETVTPGWESSDDLIPAYTFDRLQQERDTLARRVSELHGCLFELRAIVRDECPSLLNEDSGGDAGLELRIEKVLAAPPVRD